MKQIPVVILALLFISLSASAQSARTGKDYAVFFYVAEYEKDENGERLASLPETKTECEKIRDVLRDDYGFDCKLVPNATLEQIRAILVAYNEQKFGPDDQLLIFFSMHGYYDAQADRGYLAPKGALPNDAYRLSWFSYDDLRTFLSRCKARHVLLALDACYSGSFGDRSKGGPTPDFEQELDCAQKIKTALHYPSRIFYTSGSKTDKTPGKSLFASRWLEALRTGGEGGVLRKRDLEGFMRKIENPEPESGTFKGHEEGGNFVFVRKNACSDTVSNDRDGDGVPNPTDKCPDQYGLAEKNGCPDTGTNSRGSGLDDNDFDGIANVKDACPNAFGTARARGCPDADDDGIPDQSDKCPYAAGQPRWEGCPDTDGDGLPDNTDQCPLEKGAIVDKGCPSVDGDGDGVPDKSDKCPDQFGKAKREGCPDSVPVEEMPDDGLIRITGGTFMMGCTTEPKDCESNEQPTHRAILADFYIGKHEVIQKLWVEIMGNNPSVLKGCDLCPVENVSWDNIQDFLKKLNAKYPGRNYRLPTEAEWEYAARGGGQGKGNVYSGSNDVGMVAWYFGNSGNKTQPAGKRKSNELGLYDMSGNVWEWCSDWYGAYSSQSQINPRGPDSGTFRVLRGGSWSNVPQNCRVIYRHNRTPDYRSNAVGFRLARTK